MWTDGQTDRQTNMADNHTLPCLEILGASTSWSQKGLSRLVMGQLYSTAVLYCTVLYCTAVTDVDMKVKKRR